MSKMFDSNPYHGAKEIIPEWTECEACNRKLKSKDWNNHRISKKHQENASVPMPGSATDQRLKTSGKGGSPTSPANNRCFKCGQEGHRKADCTNPRNSSNMECHNCNKGKSEFDGNNRYNLILSSASHLISLRMAFSSYFSSFSFTPFVIRAGSHSQVTGKVAEVTITH